MIKILIADDNPEKVKNVTKLLIGLPEVEAGDVSVAPDLVTARDRLVKDYFDLLILDIRIPSAPGQDPTDTAGKQFVRELGASTTLIKPAHIIGLTAFDDAFAEADEAFVNEVWRIIRYDPTIDAWARQLESKVVYLLRSKRELMSGENAGYGFDLAVVTALRQPEFRAVLDLPGSWQSRRFSNDPTEYHVGIANTAGARLNVVAACSSQMGMTASAVLAMKLISNFRPRYLCIVGVAAGVKAAGVNLGDVLIAEQSWDYDSGKRYRIGTSKSKLVPDPRYIPLRSDLKERFLSSVGKGAYLAEIAAGWRGPKPKTQLQAILGPVATGAAVIEDPNVSEEIRRHARKLIGVEMETYGVFFAGENCSKPRPMVFSIKSASDFADDDKDDDLQDFASYTSAQYMWRFASEHLLQE